VYAVSVQKLEINCALLLLLTTGNYYPGYPKGHGQIDSSMHKAQHALNS